MEEENRILLIASEQTFMINSIVKELTESGWDVELIAPDINLISHMQNKPKIYFLYIAEGEELTDLYVYLKDHVIEDELAIVVAGYKDSIEEMERVVMAEHIKATFLRPINVKEIASKMQDVLAQHKKLSEKKKVLVVDDDGVMLRTIKSWLDPYYHVYMVNSGTAAISFLAKNSVDLILLDYEMPVTNGPQVLKMLRSEPDFSEIPVMFLTNKNDKDAVVEVLDLKPEKYLLKTMPPSELLATIDEFFEEQKMNR